MGAAKDEKAAEKADSPSSKKRGPPADCAKAKAAKVAKAAEPVIDEATLKKAQSLGLESPLKNLAARSDVSAKGFAHDKLLSALQGSGGLVHKAKASLLGA